MVHCSQSKFAIGKSKGIIQIFTALVKWGSTIVCSASSYWRAPYQTFVLCSTYITVHNRI